MIFIRLILGLTLIFALPEPIAGRRVHDFAGVITADDRQVLEKEALFIEQQTTAQLAIVTVSSLDGESVESYAHALMNSWGVGRRDNNNGVMFLVAPEERRARIEVGYGLESLLSDARCGELLRKHATPYFKQGEFSDGIRATTGAIVDILGRNPEAAAGKSSSRPQVGLPQLPEGALIAIICAVLSVAFLMVGAIYSTHRYYPAGLLPFFSILLSLSASLTICLTDLGSFKFLYILAILPILAIVKNYFWWRRFHPHRCTECGAQMNLLGEEEDDAKLTSSQKIEESLLSVDYDCWSCPACDKSTILEYIESSPYAECPSCSTRAYGAIVRIICEASLFGAGTRHHLRICEACRKETLVRVESIPSYAARAAAFMAGLAVGSSGSSGGSGSSSRGNSGGSSGGGSYGGGSSGGGGASAGW